MTKGGGFLTPKAISNRIKAKGLQKLRWYCQMCQKQCRDENGFKCHMKSEGHLRAMRVFSENPNRVVDEFSREFLKGFLSTLSHSHGTKRVLANKVYQEYIADKNHVHMNATCWSSLSGLCKFLGREGKCIVDETDKGWFIEYIDKDPKLLAKQAEAERRDRAEMDEEERMRRQIESQIAASNELLEEEAEPVDNSLAETHKDVVISINKKSAAAEHRSKVIPSIFSQADAEASRKSTSKASTSALDSIIEEEENRKRKILDAEDKKNRFDYWLHPGIMVKILNKQLADGAYYKQKGEVLRVMDRYVGEIRVNGAILRMDQEDLETVLPKIGGHALIVNGRGRGYRAVLLNIDEANYHCQIRIENGPLSGMTVSNVEYEDVSKIADV